MEWQANHRILNWMNRLFWISELSSSWFNWFYCEFWLRSSLDRKIHQLCMDTSWSWISAHGQWAIESCVVPARCWHDTEIIVWTSKGPPGNQWDAEASRRSCADKSAVAFSVFEAFSMLGQTFHTYHIGVVTSCHINPHYSSLTAAMIESQSRSVIAVDPAAVSSQSDRQVAALPDLLRCLPDEFWACSCYWMLLVLNREMIQSIYMYIYIYYNYMILYDIILYCKTIFTIIPFPHSLYYEAPVMLRPGWPVASVPWWLALSAKPQWLLLWDRGASWAPEVEQMQHWIIRKQVKHCCFYW